MAGPSRFIAIMLRRGQASVFTSQSCLREPLQKLQCGIKNRRAASTTSSSRVPPTTSSQTVSPFKGERSSRTRLTSNQSKQLPRDPFALSVRRPTEYRIANRLNLWTTFKTIFGWQPPRAPLRVVPASFDVLNNPYRARKVWPPDFATLHPKHQFHFEKTYKRRSKLKWTRPIWNRNVKILQHVITVTVIVWSIFITKIEGETPFNSVSLGNISHNLVDSN